MKGLGFLLLATAAAVAFMYLVYSSNGSTAFNQGMVSLTINRRILKGNVVGGRSKNTVNLEDYRPIDPVPSSTASVRPGPIQHGTPLLPYVPGPSPPPT